MLPPAPVPPNVVVGATIVKRFPGYGERRGTIAEIDLDGGKVVVRCGSGRRRRADDVVAVLGRELGSEMQELEGAIFRRGRQEAPPWQLRRRGGGRPRGK